MLSQQKVLDIVITFIRVIQGLLIVLSSQSYCGSSGHDWYHYLHQYHAQRSKEIGVMKAVGYQNH